jgi:hypothetical protein
MAVQPKPVTLPPGLLERLRGALAAVRSGRVAPDDPALPEPAAADPVPPPDARRAVIFVTVFGLSTGALEEVLEVVMRESKDAPVSPVFLTDSLEFKPFRERRLRFEYLPDGGRRQRFAPDLDWRAYERRRYRLLVEKWRPQSLISFGTPPPADCAAIVKSPA